uniref:Uncharacterized protein n=1 Tax=Helianthus annuus TaxID=4232 RepID=A0A251SNP6_HELAN
MMWQPMVEDPFDFGSSYTVNSDLYKRHYHNYSVNPSHLSFIAQLEKLSLLFTDSITRYEIFYYCLL